MSPTYKQNKLHIYNWRAKNKTKHAEGVLRSYYKKKITISVSREYADIVFIFFDILRER